jgi:hypothetical protein
MDKLTAQDFAEAAAELGCSIPAIQAVCQVESPKGGFNPDGTLTTLFEAHHFSRLTGHRYDGSHPLLSSRTWNRALYGRTWQEERKRLADASELDSVAAIMSASWGRFQIMGSNHGLCGFRDAADMVNSFARGEREQLDGFVRFILARGLADELRDRRWTLFAMAYNGPRALENGYPDKLARAYAHFGGT